MDQIEEIRSKIDLVEFISEHLPLKKAGRNFKGLCPFHTEKTPSFMVSPERQIWKCFGCQKGGDVYGFLMETERVEFGEALRILAKRTGVVLEGYRPTQTEGEKDKLFGINHLASEYFHYLLINHPVGKKALNYILQRGISKDSLEKFKIGYAPSSWTDLQKYFVGRKGYKAEDLEKAGLIIASNKQLVISNKGYYDRFRDRLMFPLLDHRGNVCGFSGRVLDPTIKEAKYVNTPETLVYHKSELLYPMDITKEDIKKENCAVVVEGEIDAISSYQVGIKNVVGIKGSALTEEQSRLLKRFCENVVLSLDADAAGDMAARRGIEIADNAGLNLKVLTMDKYKDPDEAAQKEPEYLKERLKEAENVYDFYLNSAFKRLRGQTPEEKKKIGQELVPIYAKIQDEIVKDVYIKKLADRLGVNESSIILQIEKVKTPSFVQKEAQTKPEERLGRGLLEEYYVALLLQTGKVDLLLDQETRPLFFSPVYLKLIEALEKYLVENKKFFSQFFFQTLPAELKEAFDKLYLVDFGAKIEDESWVTNEVKRAQKRLYLAKIKEELKIAWQDMKDEKSQTGEQSQQKIRQLTAEITRLEKQ